MFLLYFDKLVKKHFHTLIKMWATYFNLTSKNEQFGLYMKLKIAFWGTNFSSN